MSEADDRKMYATPESRREAVAKMMDIAKLAHKSREVVAAALTAQERKQRPVYSGVLKYFPKALMAVSKCSWAGNEQHNPGTELHWDRAKSGDELDALTRHLLQAGKMDGDGIRHSTKIAWRALANLEKEIEKEESC